MVQLDEPWMQARPEKAKAYGLNALARAFDGVAGTTAVHLCFGYAQMVKAKPSGYSFLPELSGSPVKQVSIETAQSNLDCAVLEKLPDKTIILGTLDLSDMTIEKPETVAARIRRANLTSEDKTVAQFLQASGYKTGLMGKWHLDGYDPNAVPNNFGFGEFKGWLTGIGSTQGYWPVKRMHDGQLVDIPENAGGKHGNKGFEAAVALLECHSLARRIAT